MMVCIGLIGIAGAASADEILVSANITSSETWTADNTYNLQKQIYVEPGASLTIQAGVVVASDTNVGGSLAVCKGAQIFVQGTADNPVIMTSKKDLNTWDNDPSHPTGKDPKTGSWQEGCNEWGNLTIMGKGYISENATPGNVSYPDAGNVADMEGLISGPALDRYGGGMDDDNSGSISYLSIRYGGKVISLANELNGLSLGGIGRDTDIHHVEIMNNVDDGIEIWGGCVEIKYFSIWNIGDDSFDVDQGWRGRAQYGLIVQGYSCDDSQGSGVGDNCFETDGAEDSSWQPVTTTTIFNCTVVGNNKDGDGLTAWRDNARVQYRNCIFMDCGEKVVRFDNVDGDGAHGYGFESTLSWEDSWTTAFDFNKTTPQHPNDPQNHGLLWEDIYQSQYLGNLCQMYDSVFFNNTNGAAYTEADARNVFAASNKNVKESGNSPITQITRGTEVTKGGKKIEPVEFLDPRPKAEAMVSFKRAADNGFFRPSKYRGAFGPGENWLYPWSATYAYGMTPDDGPTTGLWAETGAVHETDGGTVNFDLDAGPAYAGRKYFMLASVSGTSPGTSLPGGLTLPINQDFMFDLVFTFAPLNLFFQNFSGTLDSNGQAEATFDYPGYPGSAGLVFYFAWMCYAPFDYVSNAVPVEVTTYKP
jgi:hypothetical protein